VRVPEGGAYETAAGYAICRLQAIPSGPVAFRADGYLVTVTEIERYRVRRVRFERPPEEGITRTP
jgi:CBS domain containing-hemolysin-like protein